MLNIKIATTIAVLGALALPAYAQDKPPPKPTVETLQKQVDDLRAENDKLRAANETGRVLVQVLQAQRNNLADADANLAASIAAKPAAPRP